MGSGEEVSSDKSSTLLSTKASAGGRSGGLDGGPPEGPEGGPEGGLEEGPEGGPLDGPEGGPEGGLLGGPVGGPDDDPRLGGPRFGGPREGGPLEGGPRGESSPLVSSLSGVSGSAIVLQGLGPPIKLIQTSVGIAILYVPLPKGENVRFLHQDIVMLQPLQPIMIHEVNHVPYRG